MKKSFVRRAVALSMIGVMMLLGAATGCGKKKVDYNIDDENGGSENGGSGDSGELRAKVKAPESYTGDIPVGNSGLSSIKINAEKIEIPNASTMSVVYCEPLSYDSDYKKTLAESFFDKSKGIYKYDYEKPIREDVQKELDVYQAMLDDANAAGDTENAQWIGDTVNSLKSDLAKATDEREPVGDTYDSDSYIGYIGDQLYELDMYGDSSGANGSASIAPYPYITIKDIRPHDDCYNVSYYGDDYNSYDLENQSDMTKDEAVSDAPSYLADLGFKDAMLKSCSPLIWDYYDYAGNTLAEECDGWSITFVKSVDNVPIYSPDVWNLDYLDTNNVWYTTSDQTINLSIYNGSAFQVNINYSLNTIKEDSDVELLSWDEILKSAQEKIPEFYKDNKTSYLDLEFDKVKLTYFRVKDEDTTGQYKLIPVWAFISTSYGDEEGDTSTEEDTEEDTEDSAFEDSYPTQLILINAMDGSLIDVASQLEGESYDSDDVTSSTISDDGSFAVEKEVDEGDIQ